MTVVREKRLAANAVWAFLTLAFAAALVRAHGPLAVDVGVGGALLLVVAAWVWMRRHPARIEVTDEAVSLRNRGLPKATELRRGSGDLYFKRSGGRRAPVLTLRASGASEALLLQAFDRREVERACRAHGWRFAGDA